MAELSFLGELYTGNCSDQVLRPLHTQSETCLYVSFPIKVNATDAKTQKIEPDPNSTDDSFRGSV